MKIVFMGTPEFAVPSLKILVDHGYEIVGVVTSTDKYGGRGKKKLLESAVKKYAASEGLRVLQPPRLKRQSFVEELRSLEADLQIVVAFRMLPEVVWDMPPLGSINLHGSLLPAYRGAAPINWAVINGEKETGLTTFKLKHAIDTGDLIDQVSLPIGSNETAGELHDRMMPLGAELVLKTVQAVEHNAISETPQDESKISHAPKLFHENCQINFNKPVHDVHNFIRGLSPFPGAWTTLDDLQFNIHRSIIADDVEPRDPGTIDLSQKGEMRISCADGVVNILEGQLSGRKRMEIKHLLNGYTPEANSVTMDY